MIRKNFLFIGTNEFRINLPLKDGENFCLWNDWLLCNWHFAFVDQKDWCKLILVQLIVIAVGRCLDVRYFFYNLAQFRTFD